MFNINSNWIKFLLPFFKAVCCLWLKRFLCCPSTLTFVLRGRWKIHQCILPSTGPRTQHHLFSLAAPSFGWTNHGLSVARVYANRNLKLVNDPLQFFSEHRQCREWCFEIIPSFFGVSCFLLFGTFYLLKSSWYSHVFWGQSWWYCLSFSLPSTLIGTFSSLWLRIPIMLICKAW